MSLQVVVQELGELLRVVEVGAGGHMVAAGQVAQLPAALPPVQLVDGKLPHWERPARAHSCPDAAMWNPTMEGVRPDGHPAKGGGQGGVVDEALIGHHLKLLVATSSKERSSHPEDRGQAQIGKFLDHQPSASHLLQPDVVPTLCPVLVVRLVADREHRHLVALLVQPLNSRVVRELV